MVSSGKLARVVVRDLKLQEYLETWQAMKNFVRNPTLENEIWIVEHPPVFTQGQAGKPEHLLHNPDNIPVIQTDRGGQITYHAPGQIIFYVLLNLKHRKQGIRGLVKTLEQAVITFLATVNIHAYIKPNAPGVYTDAGKIAFIGLKVSRGYTYHGISFNYDMELKPFNCMNPCGYANLAITNLINLHNLISKNDCIKDITNSLCYSLGLAAS